MKIGIRKLTKVFAGLLSALTLIIVNPIQANATWKQDSTGWRYTEVRSYVTGWRIIDGKWYYFHTNGYMAHDC
jgi:predicted HAD superfamily phosphohydrolase YqeG